MSERINLLNNGQLKVPDHPIIPFIEGDGTGPDIWHAAQMVFDGAVKQAYGSDRSIDWLEILAGEKAFHQTGEWLPDATVETIKIASRGYQRATHNACRQGDSQYQCSLAADSGSLRLRASGKVYSWIPSPMKNPEKVDMIVFRENTEDVYAGIEWEAESSGAAKVIDLIKAETGREVKPDSGIGIKPMSRTGSRRLVKKAIEFALAQQKPSVTLVHKGNIMKFTEGAFRNWGYELAAEEYGDQTNDRSGCLGRPRRPDAGWSDHAKRPHCRCDVSTDSAEARRVQRFSHA